MRILVQSFWLTKAGNTPAEYEDCFDHTYNRRRWPKAGGRPTFFAVEREMKRPRFAVADGATETSFSGEWARLLVEAYVANGPRRPKALHKIVDQCGMQWAQEVMARPLSWFAEEKAQRGSFATLLGLSLSQSGKGREGGRWTALAVGDSCLFQVRDHQLVTAFPVEGADSFGYHPLLLSTIPERNQAIWAQQSQLRKVGEWRRGDRFFLMSDALAEWFLRAVESEAQPWEILQQLELPPQLSFPAPFVEPDPSTGTATPGSSKGQLLAERFERWIDRKRTHDSLHNDDVTLLMITIGGESDEITAVH
jgi:hypothetical protein